MSEPRLVLLDAATGTALQARGLPPDALPDEWVLARPDEVEAVHAAHAAAGARVVLACTFNAASDRLEARLSPAERDAIPAAAIALARRAAPAAKVAGSLGATGLPSDEAGPRFARAAGLVARAGADLAWLETLWDAGEARAALAGARGAGLPVVVTLTGREEAGRLVLLDGAPLEPVLAALAAEGAAAVGVNCVFAGAGLAALARWAAGALPVPLVLKPSPGLPGEVLPPEAFAAAVRPAVDAAAATGAGGPGLWLGGCCGATAAHLAALGGLRPAQAGPAARG